MSSPYQSGWLSSGGYLRFTREHICRICGLAFRDTNGQSNVGPCCRQSEQRLQEKREYHRNYMRKRNRRKKANA